MNATTDTKHLLAELLADDACDDAAEDLALLERRERCAERVMDWTVARICACEGLVREAESA